ncbi:muskelin [Entomortierella parvispora]|uniref:Muskelin n=1 Tax=Entomortierella parvispora TaxID=205924 RepID=A0A9P3M0E1_9FUNG|nr:muskelin [Entomortierella parvispora]
MMLHPGSRAPSAAAPINQHDNKGHVDPDQDRDQNQDQDQSRGHNCSKGHGGKDDKHRSADSAAALSRKQGDYLTALAIMRPCVLDYDVHSCSSYSASYLPENIKTNNPQDQSSRWSSGSNNQMQYIMIKLKTMAIAHTITFGKYHKLHVCNLKEFKVFGGLTSSNMTELLHTGLRNDHEPETFLLKHKTKSVVFPCQYIKIVPLMAWGANFNFSVWHVEVKGIPDPELVQETYFQYINFRETESVRLCLKHFRQRKLFDAFKALQERTHIELEDPLLTSLHRELVIKGNFKRAEELMGEAAERGLFDEYIQAYDYKPIWKRLRSNSHRQGTHHHHLPLYPIVPETAPRHRGGHQMCIDTKGGYVYLMGGWDGARDLADFWAYHIPTQKWILISSDTALQGGPSGRSCHKICYSPQHSAIYMLGKYVDGDNRTKVDLSPEFWRFDIDPASPPHGRWTKICANTAAVNGPELIYDHQMCLDPVSQTLYVFGGRVVHPDKNVSHYSGLYSYNIPTDTWRLLRADGTPGPKQDGNTALRSRIGHSMLYDETLRGLVIFAGQMNKDYLSDFYVYDIAADRVIEVCKDYNKQGGPEAGFTQRAAISSKEREIYVLSGLVKDRALGVESVKNSLWVFKLPGKNQMDAIRDVQLALADAKKSGSIGSLKSIMSRGRSLSDQHDADTSIDAGRRVNTSRRRVNDELQQQPGSRTNLRRARNADTFEDTASPIPSHRGHTYSDQTSSRTIQTRSSGLGRKYSSRSGTTPSASAEVVTAPAPFSPHRSDIQSIPHSLHLAAAPNGREGAVAGISSAGLSPLPMPSENTSRAAPGSSDNGSPSEPLSLAYVLSDQESWQKIFQNSSPELGEPSEPEPVPRYAHQLVFDDVNEVQYLFGGNPGDPTNMSKRLDDFWGLRLYRPSPDQIVRKAKYLLRTQQFKELCQRPETSVLTSTTAASAQRSTGLSHTSKDRNHRGAVNKPVERGTVEHHDQSLRALNFLQTELSCVVDQSNKGESDDFKALIRGLLKGAFTPATGLASNLANTGSSSQRPSFSFTGNRSNVNHYSAANMGNPKNTTVLLAPSPITSPSLAGDPVLQPINGPLAGTSGTRVFLASPSERHLNNGTFESPNRGQSDVFADPDTDGNRDSPMQSLGDGLSPGSLDHNGDRVVHSKEQGFSFGRGNDMTMEGGGSTDSGSGDRDMETDEDQQEDEGEDGSDYDTLDEDNQDEVTKAFYRDRTMLYEKLLEFFADDIKQPKGDLTDLVKVA